MSITALLWITLFCAGALFSFVNPVFGSLGYLLEYYMRPELKWWGDQLPALRWNLIISVVLGTSFLLRRDQLRKMAVVPNPALRWLVGMAVVMIFVTMTVALDRSISWEETVHWTKMAIIFPVLVVGVIRTTNAFSAFVAAHMLGAFWWGWNAWMDPKRSEGRLLDIGSGDSLNDNAAAAHLLTVLPFAIICLLTSKDKRLRLVGLIATPFIINTLILCNSRGSMVGLLAALSASVFLIRTGNRLRLVGAAIGVVAMVLSLADTQFITRQQSTVSYEKDNSAQARLESWRAALRLIQDYPLGAGGKGFELLSPRYIPDIVAAHDGELRAAHNTWALVPSEWGVLGLICYVGMYASAFLMLRRIKARAATKQGFYYWQAFAIQLALIAFLVASTFSDRLYGEAGYWMIGLSYTLYRIQRTDEAEDASVEVSGEPARMAAPRPLVGACA